MPHFERPFTVLPVLWVWLFVGIPAPGQESDPPPLEIAGMSPSGLRNSVTNKWGLFQFFLRNRADEDRLVRAVFFYKPRPDVQYGRDVWVPARSSLSTWMLAGPAPVPMTVAESSVEILFYDRTDGKDTLIPPPGELRVRDRGIFSRPAELYSVILHGGFVPEEPWQGRLPEPPSRDIEAEELVRTYRAARLLPPVVREPVTFPLPPTAEAFDGVDQFVLASDRIADDPAGMLALRRWLIRGGRLWVMLDRVDPDVLAPLLGEALDFQVIGRTGLTTTWIETQTTAMGGQADAPIIQEHERPVGFARVILPPGESVRHTVDGWPAWFTREVGRGEVLFTTLGPRGWFRPRTPDDPLAEGTTSLPVANQALTFMASSSNLLRPQAPVPLDAFRETLSEEIGYSVVGPGTVGGVFGVFLLAALALGLALRKARRPELLGWLGPAAALGAAALLFTLGESSRQVAGPTVALAQVVDAVPGVEEASVHGLLAVYRPDQGTLQPGTTRGGLFELDMAGLTGQARRMIQTDLNSWHWEDLALPAGVRFAPFRSTIPTEKPIRALARIGPDGLEGKLESGPFREPTDLVLRTANGRDLAIRSGPEGTFRADRKDVLPEQVFHSGTLLSDEQQRRQALYRAFFRNPTRGEDKGRNLLLAWAKPADLHFTLGEEPRTLGSALLIVPLELERPTPGRRLTIPAPLIPYQRIGAVGVLRAVREADYDAEMHLRFQLPPEVLPFQVERARLVTRIIAPSRQVTVSGYEAGRTVVLHRVESPQVPLRVDFTEERLLRLDEGGGLHLHVSLRAVGEPEVESQLEEQWKVEYLELEVTGQSITPE